MLRGEDGDDRQEGLFEAEPQATRPAARSDALQLLSFGAEEVPDGATPAALPVSQLRDHMAFDTPPQRNERVVSRRAEETVILLDPASGEYFTLDDVGGRIWELCDGSRTVDQIAAVLADEYDAPVDRIRADALELLTELRESQLVE